MLSIHSTTVHIGRVGAVKLNSKLSLKTKNFFFYMKSKSMMTWNQQWGHRNSCLCSSPNLVSCSVCVLVYFFSSLLWTVPHLHTHFPKFSLIISTNAQLPSCGAYYNPGGPEKYHCVAALSTFILMFINAHVFV